MRMRRKKWAVPELLAAPFFEADPASWRGRWRERFADPSLPLCVELGCGKGGFISRLAHGRPEENFLAVDLISNVLGSAKRNIERVYGERPPGNVLLASWDVERIDAILAPEDRVERLYINFCNPWPKERHQKHRLTHTRQLLRYRAFLAPGAELYFKTDDGPLFTDTLEYLSEAGFRVLEQTRDLYALPHPGNISTEHEERFAAEGVAIKRLAARLHETI